MRTHQQSFSLLSKLKHSSSHLRSTTLLGSRLQFKFAGAYEFEVLQLGRRKVASSLGTLRQSVSTSRGVSRLAEREFTSTRLEEDNSLHLVLLLYFFCFIYLLVFGSFVIARVAHVKATLFPTNTSSMLNSLKP